MADITDNEAGNLGQSLFDSLTKDANFILPEVNLGDINFQIPDSTDNSLYAKVASLTNEDLTTRTVNGSGTFDALMSSVSNHLKIEFEKNRITGKEYTTAYAQIMANVLNTATQYLLGKDTAYWQANLVQQQARQAEIESITAKVNLEISKAQLASTRYQAYNAKAQYALSKIQLATANAAYNLTNEQALTAEIEHSIRKYTYENDMPIATSINKVNLETVEIDKDTKAYTLGNILPQQNTLLKTQNAGALVDNQTKSYQLSSILPQQKNLLVEQTESARADTLTSRLSDGSLITGTKGKQRDLYEQQTISYVRDSEAKVARIFADMWITRKTLDDGLTPPTSMSDTNYNSILNGLREKVGF